MGPFLLSLCIFSCGFYPFACERENTPKDATRNIEIKNENQPPLPWPYLSLPIYQDSIVPLVNKELLKPSRMTGQEPMPGDLRKLLLPDTPISQAKPSLEPKDVVVSCPFNKMHVTVCRKSLGSRALRSQLSLGTCGVSNETESSFLFNYSVSECGSTTSIIDNQLVYSNTLYYTPDEPKGLIRMAAPFALPIFCYYNRFYYSYKIGYLPETKTQEFFQSINPSYDFTLSPCNAQWEKLTETQGYILGAPMYFEASLPYISGHQRLFVSFCYATPSQRISNTIYFTVIGNYGCMVDSRIPGSRARFIRHKRNVLRFVVEAFIFKGVPDERLYLRCEMFVADLVATEAAKSCTYNSTVGRWEELYGDTQVCSCCDSTCNTSASAAPLPASKNVVTSSSWTLEPDSGVVVGEATVEWDEITPPVTETVTEPMAKSVIQPVTKKVTEPITRKVTEPITRKVTEPVTRKVTDPVTRKVTGPVTRKVTDPVTRKVTDPVTRKVTEPVTRKVTDPVTRKVTEPVTRKVTDPVTRKVTEPVTRKVPETGIMRVTPTVTGKVTDSEIRRGAQPETRNVTATEIRRGAPSATRKVTGHGTRKVTGTRTRKVTGPGTRKVTGPETRKVTGTGRRKVTGEGIQRGTASGVLTGTDKETKKKPVEGSAVEERDKVLGPRLSFTEVFGLP